MAERRVLLWILRDGVLLAEQMIEDLLVNFDWQVNKFRSHLDAICYLIWMKRIKEMEMTR